MSIQIENQKGFSLTELLFSSFLATLLIGAFFLAIRSNDAHGNILNVKMSMEEQGMNALRKMEYELRQSSPSRVTVGVGGSSITFDVPSDPNPVSTSTYNIDWTGAHTITYSVSNGQLIRTDADAITDLTPRILSNFVSGVTFDQPTTGIITIALNLSQTLKNTRTIAQTLSAKVQLRNP